MSQSQLPRWSVDGIYPGLQSSAFRGAVADARQEIVDIESAFDQVEAKRALGDAEVTVDDLETVLQTVNGFADRLRTLNSYVHAHITTDSRDEMAAAAASEMDPILARFRKLSKRVTSLIGGLDVEPYVAAGPQSAAHAFFLRKAKGRAAHLLPADQESLISDLELTGSVAWGRLHGAMTSQLEATITGPDGPLTAPMPVVRAMASDASAEVRKSAYDAEIAAWKTIEVPMAAALNSIKGEVSALSRRRGWESPLHEALDGNNMDIETLNAKLDAAEAAFPIFRRYLKVKAAWLKKDRLPWWDLFAPVGTDIKPWDYAEATEFVEAQFRGYSDRMGDFARRAFAENWIDAEPRSGKRDGAYCMSVRGDESRILMNYRASFDSVSTLAHELGHGYHNLCLASRTPLQRATPMTLAETASIFCETIIRQAVLKEGSPEAQLAILDGSLQGATQVVVDISSRFRFERAVFERRADRELSPREFCDLMLDAQRQTYGDGLDESTLHPYMWAVKGHYYSRSFYNYPYMFGLLFALGLYELFEQDPAGFLPKYDDLLSSTGMDDAAALAGRFGFDIRSSKFWAGSLAQIARDVERFETLVLSLGTATS